MYIIIPILIAIIILTVLFKLYMTYSSKNVFYHGSRDKHQIALTFDDGPSKETLEVIKILKKEKVCATFFVTGKSIEKNPEVFKKLIKSKNEIGNHSYEHRKLNFLTRKIIHNNILLNDQLLNKYKIKTKIFRPPYFLRSWVVDSELKIFNKKMIICDVISRDYKNFSPEKVAKIVLKNIKNGSIVDFHDFAYGIGEMRHVSSALGIIIKELKKQGYKFVTVSEMLGFR